MLKTQRFFRVRPPAPLPAPCPRSPTPREAEGAWDLTLEVRSPPRPPPRPPPRRPPRLPPPAQDVPSSQDREWCFLSLNFAEKAKSGVWQGRKLGERPPHRAPPPRSPFPEPSSPSPSRATASAPSFPRRSKTFHQWAEERKHAGTVLPRVVRDPHGFGVASPAGPAPGGRPQTVYADRR